MSLTYKEAGVNAEKAGNILSSFAQYLKSRPKDPNVLSGIGPYASCYSLKSLINDFEDPVLVTSCDGVGTKSKLALDWGNISTLGEDLVAMNVNDLLCVGGLPFLFLDYYACGKLDDAQLTALLKSIQHGCELAGCSLVGGETAEMPGIYTNQDFDLAGFAVGLTERSAILGADKIKAGDILVALPSSGLHSNGYSLVRKILENESISPEAKVPFGNSNQTWKDLLLTPTTIYVPYLKDVLNTISGLSHITGGGLFENLPRILPAGHIAHVSSSAWQFPEIFTWIKEKAAISTREILSTFNCGVGMIAVLPPANVSSFLNHLKKKDLFAYEIGVVEKSSNSIPLVEWH